AYRGIKAPNTIRHRYLLEDVPTGVIPMIELGQAAGLPLPTLRSLVRLAGIALGENRWQDKRTLHMLGLANRSIKDIHTIIERGYIPSHDLHVRLRIRRNPRYHLAIRSMSA